MQNSIHWNASTLVKDSEIGRKKHVIHAAAFYEPTLSKRDNESYFYDVCETYFHSRKDAKGNTRLEANAVMIDTEEKVVIPNLQ